MRVNAARVRVFRCTLPAGTYVFKVFATDVAGDRQAKVGRGKLIAREG
jgi:hypothetical protein